MNVNRSLAHRTILVVEDNKDIFDLLKMAFERVGASVITARYVDEAVAAFRHTPPHGVVADIQLGDSDGYALLEAIREINEQYRGITPVRVVTAYVSHGDEDRAKSARVAAYLPKPSNPAETVR